MDIRLKEIYVNLKKHEFELFGAYKINETEAKKFMDAVEDMMEKENEDGRSRR